MTFSIPALYLGGHNAMAFPSHSTYHQRVSHATLCHAQLTRVFTGTLVPTFKDFAFCKVKESLPRVGAALTVPDKKKKGREK